MTTTIIAAFNDGRLPATFWNKVTVSRDACWLWTGCCNTKGYGRFSWQQSPFIQRDWLAHRASWVHLVGQSRMV